MSVLVAMFYQIASYQSPYLKVSQTVGGLTESHTDAVSLSSSIRVAVLVPLAPVDKRLLMSDSAKCFHPPAWSFVLPG